MPRAHLRYNPAAFILGGAVGLSLLLHLGAGIVALGSQPALYAALGLGAVALVALLGWGWGWLRRERAPLLSGRRSNRGRSPTRTLVGLLAALLVHGVLVVLIVTYRGELLPGNLPAASAPASGLLAEGDGPPIEIENLGDRMIESLQRPLERTEDERKTEEKRKKEEEDPEAKGKLVDIARPAIEQRPEEAAHLAEYDSTVERETRGPSGKSPAGAPTPPSPPPLPIAQPVPQGLPAEPGPRSPPADRPAAHARTPLPGQSGPVTETGEDGTQRRAGAPVSPGATGGRLLSPAPPGLPGQPGQLNLIPSQDALARAVGQGGGSFDDLRDLDDGEHTALNAKRWKYATYFNRIRRPVAEQWHPDVVYTRHDPSGNVYGLKDRVTVLRVRLKSDGNLDSLKLLETSGVDFLDDEAMDAFRRAQPFPNPPSTLVEADGSINFSFGFIFELSGRASLKFFRYQ